MDDSRCAVSRSSLAVLLGAVGCEARLGLGTIKQPDEDTVRRGHDDLGDVTHEESSHQRLERFIQTHRGRTCLHHLLHDRLRISLQIPHSAEDDASLSEH